MSGPVNRVGQEYGRLSVVSMAGSSGKWHCRCECGAMRIIRDSSLDSGLIKSCACSMHGHAKVGAKTPEYTAWASMCTRCTNTNSPDYRLYGGRGISICKQWLKSPLAFLSDMGPRPSKGHSLDRIDNSLGYFPANCKWSSVLEQAENRRTTIWVSVGGVTKTQTQWSRDLGGCSDLVGSRLKAGWAKEEAVTTPPGQRRTPNP